MTDQHDALGRQLDEMQNEQRAWLYASDIKMVSPVVFDDIGLRLMLAYMAKNTGKNPANNVDFKTRAVVGDFMNRGWARDVCSVDSSDIGQSVFPGAESIPEDPVTYVPKQYLATRWTLDKSTNRRFILAITVRVCLSYVDAVTGKSAITPFKITITKRNTGVMKDAVIWEGEPVSVEDAVITADPTFPIPPT